MNKKFLVTIILALSISLSACGKQAPVHDIMEDTDITQTNTMNEEVSSTTPSEEVDEDQNVSDSPDPIPADLPDTYEELDHLFTNLIDAGVESNEILDQLIMEQQDFLLDYLMQTFMAGGLEDCEIGDGSIGTLQFRTWTQMLNFEHIETALESPQQYWSEWSEHAAMLYTRNGYDFLAENGYTVSARYAKLLDTIDAPVESISSTPDSETSEEPSDTTWDASTPITTEEFALSNGIRMRMTYEEAMSILGEVEGAPDTPSGEYINFEAGEIWYTFYPQEDGKYRLTQLNITEDCTDIKFFRDIGPGQNIEEVFSKIPAWDTELKQWAWQVIYEIDGYNSYLSFIALSYYGMRIETPEMMAHITFSRVGTNVKWIEVYA